MDHGFLPYRLQVVTRYLVPEDVLDLPDATALEKESGRHGVPQHCRLKAAH